jgi:hypothetical protein
MTFDWIKKQALLRSLLTDDFDFSEAHSGFDLALSPEIIGFLIGQTSSGTFAGREDRLEENPLILDEHELAIG